MGNIFITGIKVIICCFAVVGLLVTGGFGVTMLKYRAAAGMPYATDLGDGKVFYSELNRKFLTCDEMKKLEKHYKQIFLDVVKPAVDTGQIGDMTQPVTRITVTYRIDKKIGILSTINYIYMYPCSVCEENPTWIVNVMLDRSSGEIKTGDIFFRRLSPEAYLTFGNTEGGGNN